VTPLPLAHGDVVLTRFPFTDLTGSSVVRGALALTDYTVETTHPEFVLTGLRVTSVIRTHKLAAVERSVIVRRLGRLGPQLQAEVDRLLRMVLGL
jgi:mRNA interferase MazF